jgi:hypothetical protein
MSAVVPPGVTATAALAAAQVTAGVPEQLVEAIVAVSVVVSPIKMVTGFGVTVTLWTAHDGSVPPPHAASSAMIPTIAADSQRFAP